MSPANVGGYTLFLTTLNIIIMYKNDKNSFQCYFFIERRGAKITRYKNIQIQRTIL